MIERDVAELRARVTKLERTVAWLEAHLGVKAPVVDEMHGVSSQVAALVRSGDKISAIKLHMQDTGANLIEAKKLIDSLG